jgi:ABC-type phosphate transport system substrate-binding protein
MNAKKQTSVAFMALSIIAITVALIAGLTNSPTWGQQQNVTNATTSTMVNQTTTTGAGRGVLANLTSQDFEPLQDSLNEARAAIHDNDTAAALEALNNTETQLSELNSPEPVEEEEDETSEDESEDDTALAEDPDPLIATPN